MNRQQQTILLIASLGFAALAAVDHVGRLTSENERLRDQVREQDEMLERLYRRAQRRRERRAQRQAAKAAEA